MGKQSCTLASVIPVQTSLDKAKRKRVHVCHGVCVSGMFIITAVKRKGNIMKELKFS